MGSAISRGCELGMQVFEPGCGFGFACASDEGWRRADEPGMMEQQTGKFATGVSADARNGGVGRGGFDVFNSCVDPFFGVYGC